MELHLHLVHADRLDRIVEDDLVAHHREAAFGDRGRDVAGVDRTVEDAGLAGLAQHDEGLAVELGGDGGGFGLALQVARFELGALGLELGDVGLGGAQRLAARQKEVAGEARLHLHHVADLAELFDAFEKNDLHGPFPLS